VTVGALLLGATAKAMNDSVRMIEICSYALIVAVGLRLVWVKGVGLVREYRSLAHGRQNIVPGGVALSLAGHRLSDLSGGGDCGCGHEHRAPFACHGHDHDHERCEHDDLDVLPWGHAHGPEPSELAGPDGWRHGLSAVIGVGLRPCSGAILVLVFALAQGLFWTGVASTLMMGLGTAITVAVSAILAVSAKSLMEKVADGSDGYGVLAMKALETAAAIAVCMFGVLLLAGYIASERLAGF
jgi:nickel/cobalt exporter